MRTSLVVWAVCSVVGGAIVALPDASPRLFSFSQAHGPSAVEGIGILVLIAGWSAPLVAGWQRRDRIAEHAGTPALGVALVALGFGAGLLVASVGSGYAYWWAIGAATLVAGQLLVARLTGKERAPVRPR